MAHVLVRDVMPSGSRMDLHTRLLYYKILWAVKAWSGRRRWVEPGQGLGRSWLIQGGEDPLHEREAEHDDAR